MQRAGMSQRDLPPPPAVVGEWKGKRSRLAFTDFIQLHGHLSELLRGLASQGDLFRCHARIRMAVIALIHFGETLQVSPGRVVRHRNLFTDRPVLGAPYAVPLFVPTPIFQDFVATLNRETIEITSKTLTGCRCCAPSWVSEHLVRNSPSSPEGKNRLSLIPSGRLTSFGDHCLVMHLLSPFVREVGFRWKDARDSS
jgi:hypothetical protein